MLVCYLACEGVCCDQCGPQLQLVVLPGPMLSCCVPASSMSCCTLPVFLMLLPPCSQDSKHPAITRYCHDLSCAIVVLWSCFTYVLNKPALQFILSNSHTLCKPVADFMVYNLWVAHDEVLHNVWLDSSCSALQLQDLKHKLLVGNEHFKTPHWGFKMQ